MRQKHKAFLLKQQTSCKNDILSCWNILELLFKKPSSRPHSAIKEELSFDNIIGVKKKFLEFLIERVDSFQTSKDFKLLSKNYLR